MTSNFTHRFTTLLTLLVLIAAAGCSGETESGQETDGAIATASESDTPADTRRQVRVETIRLQPTSFEDVIEITGAVEAQHDATVSAQATGTLVYRVPRGASVPRNGRIAQIDSTLLHASYLQTRAQLDAARAQFDLANDSFKRQEPLFQDSIISAIEFENVRAQLNQAMAQLNQAKAMMSQIREQLENTRVTAPFAGTVETFMAEVGEMVSPGMQVARIVNTRRVKVTAGVPERYANEIEKGSAVRVLFDAYGGAEYTGEVTFVGRAININNRTFPVEIELENEKEMLKPEMVARIYLSREMLEDVIVIPQDAVPLDETGHSVFVVIDENGTLVAERRSITIGPSYAGQVVVESGLYAGDEVVVTGQYSLTNGDAVEVVETNQSESSALSQAAGINQ